MDHKTKTMLEQASTSNKSLKVQQKFYTSNTELFVFKPIDS